MTDGLSAECCANRKRHGYNLSLPDNCVAEVVGHATQFRGRKLGDVGRARSIEQSGEDCISFRFVSDHSRRYDSKEPIKQYLNCIVMALVAFASFLSQTRPIAQSECVVILHVFLRAIGLAKHGITAKASAVSLHSCRC